MKRETISIFLLILIAFLIVFVFWRWLYLPKLNLDLIDITISQKTPTALDKIIQKNIRTLINKPSLLAQFKHAEKNISINNLWVDKCEVSQADFAKFTSYQALKNPTFKTDPNQPKNWHYYSQTSKHKILGQNKAPVSGVSFFDAFAYCQANNGRLPNSDEFEAISVSKQRQLYPWGNKPISSPWQYYDPVLNISKQCGEYQEAISQEGIADLGNNVSEWTIDKLGNAWLMGGNAHQRPASLFALSFIRREAPKDFRSQFTGFRCVYDKKNDKNATQTIQLSQWKSKHTLIKIKDGNYTIGVDNKSKIATLIQTINKENINLITDIPNYPATLTAKIMRYEVTVAQYQKFLSDPLVKLGFFNHPKQPKHIQHKPSNYQQQLQQKDTPIVNITWWSAWSFAKWVGGQLPNASQWQYIAGHHLTKYPYGNEYKQGLAIDRNYPQNSHQATAVYLSKDKSFDNILGLSGNVAEWTNTIALKGQSFLIYVKGGNYLMPKDGSEVSQSSEAKPDYTSNDIGFRVIFFN